MTQPEATPHRTRAGHSAARLPWLRALALTAACALAAPAQAARFEIALDALAGTYASPGEVVAVDFDFGQPFARIDELRIRLDVEGQGGVCAGFSCTPFTFWEARLDDLGRDVSEGRFRSGQLTPAGRRVVESRFGSRFVETAIDPETGQIIITELARDAEPSFLLDGAATLELALGGFLDADLGLVPSTVPSGQIFSAALVIEGTAIPEPMSALLLPLGGAAIALGLRGYGARSTRNASG